MVKALLRYIIPIICLTTFVQSWSGFLSISDHSIGEEILVCDMTEETVIDANVFEPIDNSIALSRPTSSVNAQRLQNSQRRTNSWFRCKQIVTKVCRSIYSRHNNYTLLSLKFSPLFEPSDCLPKLGRLVI